jgi:hypothetical protein
LRVPLRKISAFDKAGLKELNDFAREVNNVLNEGIEITKDGATEENVFCDLVVMQFSGASAHQTFTHDLKRTPFGVIPVRMDLPCSIWFETNPTSADIELKCSETASGTVLIF